MILLVSRSRFGLCLCVVLACLFVPARQLFAACDFSISALPYTASQSGKTYCLTGNIPSGTLSVAADNLTIDGQNFSIGTDLTLDGRMGVTVTRLATSGSITIRYGGNNEISQCTSTFMEIYISRGNRLINNTINADGSRAIMVEGDSDSKQFSRDNLIKGTVINGSAIADARYFYSSYTLNNTYVDNDVRLLNSTAGSSLLTMYYSHYNTFSHNNFLHTVAAGQSEGGSYMRDQSSYNLLEFNTFDDNFRTFGLTSGNEIGFSRFNNFHGNTFKGGNYVLYVQAADSTNYFNYNLVLASSGVAATTYGVADNDGIEFRNNTIIAPQGDGVSSDGISTTRQYLFQNNIFVTTNSANFSLPASINLNSNYNLLWRKNSGALVNFGGAYNSLATWQATGRDAQSITYSPPPTPTPASQAIFINEAAGDYHLSAGSIARGKGSGGVDLGAFPYSGTCSPDWRCSEWGTCAGNQRSRTCQDRNSCGISQGAPPTSMTCVATTFSPACTPNWSCANWGACGSVYKYRHCGDLNACEKVENMPSQYVACSASCTQLWSCSAWSACSNGTQTRTCADTNACPLVNGVPGIITSRKCVYNGPVSGIDALAPAAPSGLVVN